MKNTTLEIQKHSGRINRIFGGRYRGTLISDDSYLFNVYKYILLNPVKAKIAIRAEHYPYSTLYAQHHSSPILPIIIEGIIPSYAFNKYQELNEIEWINLGYDEFETKSIQSGLKKSAFEYAKNRSTGRRIIPKIRHPLK